MSPDAARNQAERASRKRRQPDPAGLERLAEWTASHPGFSVEVVDESRPDVRLRKPSGEGVEFASAWQCLDALEMIERLPPVRRPRMPVGVPCPLAAFIE